MYICWVFRFFSFAYVLLCLLDLRIMLQPVSREQNGCDIFTHSVDKEGP